ncbi:MAG: TVP38/TMEM64 family protein [Chloroflexi bacterium]|nr:TVP38/TMEM64 family protein [Chloroflexota bacterium]
MASEKKTVSLPFLSRARSLAVRISRRLYRIYRNRRVRFGLFIVLALWAWFSRSQLVELGALILDQQRISAYIQELGLFGPLVLWFLNVAQIIIAVIPGHVLFFVSGYIYGTVDGFLLLYSSTIVAGQIAFLLARYFGRPMVVRFVPARSLFVWDRVSEKNGFVYYFILLLVPVFPTDVLTYVAGLSKISVLKFTIANMLGRAPYIFLMTIAGALGIDFVVNSLSPTAWVLLLLAVIAIVMLFRFFVPRLRREIINQQ